MRRHDRGFFLLCAYEILVGAILIVSIGLTRTVTETRASHQFLGLHQADHLAEAGLDAALVQLEARGTFNQAQVDELLKTPLFTNAPLLGGTYCVSLQQDDANKTEPAKFVTLVARGTSGGACGTPNAGPSRTLTVVVELPTATQNAFNYTMTSIELNLDGHAQLGDLTHEVMLYINGEYSGSSQSGANILAASANDVYASQLDFYNPNGRKLTKDDITGITPVMCAICNDTSTFHHWDPASGTWTLPPMNVHFPTKLPDIAFSLRTYYDEAVREQTADGQAYHHITQNTTLPDVGCSSTPCGPSPYQGVIYVECGVDLTLGNAKAATKSITIDAVIVHEGCGGKITVPSNERLEIGNTNTFAKGLAIIGAPLIDFPNTADMLIHGCVMGAPDSTIAANGTIYGSVIGTAGVPASPSDPLNLLNQYLTGPGTSWNDVMAWPMWATVSGSIIRANIHLGGSSKVLFVPLTDTPPGFNGTGSGGTGVKKPTIKMWSD